ncbi:acetyl-CoA carboxylase biotin carboxyl carrier protein [Psychrobacter sanguinis]|uniref:Acetyl-CoA carboxylase biotin carboxyl carrier protein subunit n=1 Tax=Psychrobacter sanguinis TaxID=861445 RepID=A0A844M224_9GAMM|nr:biotin/lipoyl-containing protein [Psychrobacter sanguinis]MUG32730.1 acetyl-CoA carboxylase biotin carboxyl carrier protein subunit [Psychrobacter sanguinis]
MDITTIEAVVKKVANSSVQQVTISEGTQSITVVNRSPSQLSSTASYATAENSATAEDSATAKNSTAAADQQGSDSNKPAAKHITSTYVGYVQLGKDAAAAPLVQPGDSVQVGQTVAYIDVLSKLMPVLSEDNGIVEAVLVNNADKVDYGKPLIKLQ